MRDKISIPIFIYKDTEAVKKVIDMLNESPVLSKQQIYSKLSRRRARGVWGFLQTFNNEVNKELMMLEQEIRGLFTFREVTIKADSKHQGIPKHWEIERNYTINSYEIDGGYMVKILLK